jgi:hypothetical protein
MGYAQTSDDILKTILGIEATPDMDGKSMYVEGGEGSESEDTFYATTTQWLGAKHAEMLGRVRELISEMREAHLKKTE